MRQWRAAAVPTSRRLMSLTQEGDTLGNEARRLCRMGAPGCHQSARRIVLWEPPASRAQGSDRVQGQRSQLSATTWSLVVLALRDCGRGEGERGHRAHRWALGVGSAGDAMAMAMRSWWCGRGSVRRLLLLPPCHHGHDHHHRAEALQWSAELAGQAPPAVDPIQLSPLLSNGGPGPPLHSTCCRRVGAGQSVPSLPPPRAAAKSANQPPPRPRPCPRPSS